MSLKYENKKINLIEIPDNLSYQLDCVELTKALKKRDSTEERGIKRYRVAIPKCVMCQVRNDRWSNLWEWSKIAPNSDECNKKDMEEFDAF